MARWHEQYGKQTEFEIRGQYHPSESFFTSFEIEKGDGYMQMHNLWTALGAKYKPSMIYKMRLITVESNQIENFIPEL